MSESMKDEKKIPQAVLIERLSKKMNYPIRVNHFAVLVHGWMKRRPREAPDVTTLRVRRNRSGYLWFNPREVEDLSAYAGYDLTRD